MQWPVIITAIRPVVVNVTPRTNWIFVRVDTNDAMTGLGEATLDGHEPQVLAEIAAAAGRLGGQPAEPLARLTRPHPAAFGGLAHAAAGSAIEAALWDLQGQRVGASIAELLGGANKDGVRAYANVNRAILGDRSASAFSAAARAALADGFTALKIAPFDGLRWEAEQEPAGRAAIEAGLERIAAVRETIGPDIDLAIECHGRFNVRTATVVLPQIEAFDPYWIEAPVPESDLAGWQRVRDATGARLAGGEGLVGLPAFRRFIEASRVDVVMPDVKWCGGIRTLTQIAGLAEAFGIVVAPHNPSGPVGTAATVQVAVALPHVIPIVEFAWGEATWRNDLVGGVERLESGRLFPPTGPGLGLRLDDALAAAHPFRETPVGPDLWER
jgi:galactonate dehydratase